MFLQFIVPYFTANFPDFTAKQYYVLPKSGYLYMGECIVIQHNSEKLAQHFVDQKWVSADDYEWCVYVIEKKMYHYGYIFVLLMISYLIGSFCNTDVDNFATMLYNIVKTVFNRKEVKT